MGKQTTNLTKKHYNPTRHSEEGRTEETLRKHFKIPRYVLDDVIMGKQTTNLDKQITTQHVIQKEERLNKL